jgi:predicted CoA-binding protein
VAHDDDYWLTDCHELHPTALLSVANNFITTAREKAGMAMDGNIARILKMKVVAVVGLSRDATKPSHDVARYLKENGYKIIPVNPTAVGSEILGEKVYAKLEEIPKEMKVEVVDIFRRSEDVPPVVDSAIAIGAKAVWLQLGIVNEDAAEKARKAGLNVVQDKCMKIEHVRLAGKN